MPEIRIRTLEEGQVPAWSDVLISSATFTALPAWSNLVRDMYGYKIHGFEAIRDDEVVGLLVLTHVQHPIFGNYLTTAPFGSYGGFTYSTLDARDVLLEKAQALANELSVEYVNVRFEAGSESPPNGWLQHPIYSTYCADLNPDSEKLLSTYGSDHRNHVRKSLKKNFSVKFGHLDLLDDAYEALVRSMHELGSPYHGKKYLRAMAESLGDKLEFAVLYNAQKKLAGAGVFITLGNTVTNLHANILRDQRSDYAGEFLYWSVIQRYSQKGFEIFDIGRSLNGSGNETFKMKWKPRKVSLAYWYYLPKGGPIPELNQKSAKFQLAIRIWKILPAFVVRALGPSLIRGLA